MPQFTAEEAGVEEIEDEDVDIGIGEEMTGVEGIASTSISSSICSDKAAE